MKGTSMIRRTVTALLVVIFLFGCSGAVTEGILPSLTEDDKQAPPGEGILPSLGEDDNQEISDGGILPSEKEDKTENISTDGLLPSFSEVAGVPMPSIGNALQRYPDSETENEDGSVTELYTGIKEEEYKIISNYLIDQGAQLTNYQVENKVLTAEIQLTGASFFLTYDSRTGEITLIYPSDTYDERMKNARTHFEEAKKQLEKGKPDEACMEILAIPQYEEYKPAADLLSNDGSLIAAMRKVKMEPYMKPRSIVTFGRYEQDNNVDNGPEAIEWIVLEYDDENNRTLLISKYGLDAFRYHNEWERTSWEESNGRKWLNSDFISIAFNSEEQKAILTTKIDNSRKQGIKKWRVNGKDTEDRIFLLSYAEANNYFAVSEWEDDNNAKARVAPTAYAISQGAEVNENYLTEDGRPAGTWWLRTQTFAQTDAADVSPNGGCKSDGVNMLFTARPVFWLDLNADIF